MCSSTRLLPTTAPQPECMMAVVPGRIGEREGGGERGGERGREGEGRGREGKVERERGEREGGYLQVYISCQHTSTDLYHKHYTYMSTNTCACTVHVYIHILPGNWLSELLELHA